MIWESAIYSDVCSHMDRSRWYYVLRLDGVWKRKHQENTSFHDLGLTFDLSWLWAHQPDQAHVTSIYIFRSLSFFLTHAHTHTHIRDMKFMQSLHIDIHHWQRSFQARTKYNIEINNGTKCIINCLYTAYIQRIY